MNGIAGLYLSAAGMQVEQARLDLTAQNLSNADTPGYKRAEAALQGDSPMSLVRVDNALGRPAAAIGALGTAPFVGQVAARWEQGPLRSTGQALDVAIAGQGMFVVQTPAGTLYTRRGDFHQDAAGRLVTAEGYPVLAGGQPVASPDAPLRIDARGGVHAGDNFLGALDVVVPAGELRRAGGGYWQAADPAAAAPPAGQFQLHVGSLEQSNVDPLQEMVNLMTAIRTYEANQKVLQAQDEALGKAAGELART